MACETAVKKTKNQQQPTIQRSVYDSRIQIQTHVHTKVPPDAAVSRGAGLTAYLQIHVCRADPFQNMECKKKRPNNKIKTIKTIKSSQLCASYSVNLCAAMLAVYTLYLWCAVNVSYVCVCARPLVVFATLIRHIYLHVYLPVILCGNIPYRLAVCIVGHRHCLV